MAAYTINPHGIIVRESDSAFIPANPANADYRDYLAWVDVGNTATVEEPSTPVPDQISDRQFFQALALQAVITQDEALAAVRTGAIPAALQVFIDTLPTDQKFAAEMLVSGAVVFNRDHPLTAAIAAGLQWSDEQVDVLWTSAAAL